MKNKTRCREIEALVCVWPELRHLQTPRQPLSLSLFRTFNSIPISISFAKLKLLGPSKTYLEQTSGQLIGWADELEVECSVAMFCAEARDLWRRFVRSNPSIERQSGLLLANFRISLKLTTFIILNYQLQVGSGTAITIDMDKLQSLSAINHCGAAKEASFGVVQLERSSSEGSR